MDMLVVGNGFDLAHGLPTHYTDFLEFVNAAKKILRKIFLHILIQWNVFYLFIEQKF